MFLSSRANSKCFKQSPCGQTVFNILFVLLLSSRMDASENQGAAATVTNGEGKEMQREEPEGRSESPDGAAAGEPTNDLNKEENVGDEKGKDAKSKDEGSGTLDKKAPEDKQDASDEKMEVDDDIQPLKKAAMKKTDSEAMAASDRQEEESEDPVDVENMKWPTDLKDFGYHFNADGEMRHIETDKPFEFKIKEQHAYNQKRYEAIGDLITEYVYRLLEEDCKLKRIMVPESVSRGDKQSFIFMSDDALKKEKLMLIIHGSGVVRAGQWARRLIMNENLEKGTQIPYIKRAMEEGYGVIVFNTNHNYVMEDGVRIRIKGNETPEDHALYVWKHFVKEASAEKIAIVAHSYGGVVTTDLAIHMEKDFMKRVFAIAFTDSVHSLSLYDAPSSVIKAFQKRAKNWVSSPEPLDTPVEFSSRPRRDSPRVSAGHPKHEWTSYAAFESVFKFISDKYAAADEPEEKEEL